MAFANLQQLEAGDAPKLPISPQVGEMSGRTEGVLSRRHLISATQAQTFEKAKNKKPASAGGSLAQISTMTIFLA
ncbi:hypothetical protein MES5069_1270027 [Mesorhizobium escarrei]|uniref:Uncharacterized protein n=1 Tax=Mesorhizobium escarrei TaxID=666018 RepID=A0ABM9DJA6_9HYPH|nr:hypothetical protein MES5069_1270027 [Mesorhizobium escarrei]